MKLAVSGKGGVGKTTISALLATALKAAGQRVVAIDADPDANLLACMGYPEPETVPPLVELKDLIEERTGVKPGTVGGMFRLNPFVEDIPERHAVTVGDIKVLVAGAVKKGGSGCYCPENSLLRALVSHLLMDESSALVIDMEAGVEHLSRGTIQTVDQLVIVVDPGRRSIETAQRIVGMAEALSLKRAGILANKIRSESDQAFVREALADIPFLGAVPYSESVNSAERSGVPVSSADPTVADAIAQIVETLCSKGYKGAAQS